MAFVIVLVNAASNVTSSAMFLYGNRTRFATRKYLIFRLPEFWDGVLAFRTDTEPKLLFANAEFLLGWLDSTQFLPHNSPSEEPLELRASDALSSLLVILIKRFLDLARGGWWIQSGPARRYP